MVVTRGLAPCRSRRFQALAAVWGRRYVVPGNMKYLAVPALVHRLIPRTEARLRGHTAEAIVREIISSVTVPAEQQARR